jgi:chaperonin GroES
MSTCPVQPIRDRIVVELIENETVTEFGLVIPDSANEKPTQAVVLGVGSGRIAEDGTIVPLVIGVGDRVLFSKNAGQTITVESKNYHILREDEVVAIIRGEN